MAHLNSIFPIVPGERYHITVGILGFDKQFHDVNILADTGNDVTLLKASTAKQLGVDPQTLAANTFPVSGISGAPNPFKEIKTLVLFPGLRPTWITVGLAQQEDHLTENLLGRKDILDNGKYEISYDNDSVTIRERHINFNLGDGSEEGATQSANSLDSSYREGLGNIRLTNLI